MNKQDDIYYQTSNYKEENCRREVDSDSLNDVLCRIVFINRLIPPEQKSQSESSLRPKVYSLTRVALVDHLPPHHHAARSKVPYLTSCVELYEQTRHNILQCNNTIYA